MSADLSTLLRDAAETGPAPTPVDTTEVWTRGRRQRLVRRTAPVMAVLAVVGLGAGAVATTFGDDLMQPLTTEEGAPLDDGSGWTEVNPIKGLDLAAIEPTVLDDATAPVVATADLGSWVINRKFDVDAQGTLVWVDPEKGILVQEAASESIEVLGMPTDFLVVDGEWIIHTVQWGPDGRIYLNGQDPEAESPHKGLTQIAVVERDGTLVGVRDNDALQHSPFVFADGFAWQVQRSDVMLDDGGTVMTTQADQQRWQAVAEVGGRVLKMPEQRASEVVDTVAPDGMSTSYRMRSTDDSPGDRLEVTVQVDDTLSATQLRSVGWGGGPNDPVQEGYRLWHGHAVDSGGFFGRVTGNASSIGGMIVLSDSDGRTLAIRNEGVLDRVNNSTIVLGDDGHLYLAPHAGEGPTEIRRYAHRVPGWED